MTPAEMISKLSIHFPPRFDSAEQQSAWLKDVAEAFKGYDKRVLADAVKHIIAHRKVRTFPLIAEIKEACGKSDPYGSAPREPVSYGPSKRAPDPPEAAERLRSAREFQHAMAAQYGTFANYLKATRHEWRSQFAPNERPSKQTAVGRGSLKPMSGIARRIIGEGDE